MNGFDALPELMTMDQLAERLGVTPATSAGLSTRGGYPSCGSVGSSASTPPRSPSGLTATASIACGPNNTLRS